MSTNAQLLVALAVLLCFSAFFSGSETALMRLSPFRLRALARRGHLGARLAEKLLARPDRLIGLILAGNNAVNVAASALTTILALRIGGEPAVAVGGGILLLVVLIFAELAPKTLAALHPERIALPSAIVYYPLLFVCYPIVWFVNTIANGLLRLIGVRVDTDGLGTLTREELHAAVSASGTVLPARRQLMLLRILELEKVTAEDVMVPRSDIVGLELDDSWDELVTQIQGASHTRLPVYRDGLDNIVGVLHLRGVIKALARGTLDKAGLEAALQPAYFVPEDTPLNKQLVNFNTLRERIGLVVDEYGDIQGLITLDDILQEIVGEYSSQTSPSSDRIDPQDDGSYVVDGSVNIRALNRRQHWALPVDGPKTLNGLITERLQTIPEPGTELDVDGYAIRVLRTKGNAVQTVRLVPAPGEDDVS